MSTMAWAIDGEEQEHKLKMEAMGLQVPEAAPALEQEKSITIRATSKPYSGFQGVVVTPKAKQYPEGAEGIALDLLDNWDTMPLEDASKAQEKLSSLIREMSYEELKNIYEGYPNNSLIGNAMHQIWQTTMRSGENGFRVSRSSASEVEPNDDMSSANAMATDTVSAYITAYDEDWFSVTVSNGSDWVLETHASSGSQNAGDTKLYLYTDTSSENHIVYDDDGGTSAYSKITYRFEDADAGTYYIKVTGFSSTTSGAYLLTASTTDLPLAYGNVVINEINYNPMESGTDTTEFFELLNIGSVAVDLGGVDVSEGVTFTFPVGATLASGDFLVVAGDSAGFRNYYGENADYIWTSGGLSNGGEDIELVDSLGTLIDYVDFEDGSSSYETDNGWNPSTDGNGATYELMDPTADNNDGHNWRGWGTVGGTPGAANSAQPDISMGSSITSYQAVGSSIAATFQLNNDGDADLTVSSVTVDSTYVPGATLSSEGFETWPPTGWTLSPSSGTGAWAQDSGDDYGPGSANSGSYSAFFNDYDYSSSSSGTMTSPAIDLSSVSGANVVFYYWDSSGSDVVVVSASTDGTTFTTIYTTSSAVSPWTEVSVDLASYIGNSAVYIQFSGTSVWGSSNPHIDDFAVQAAGANVLTTWLSATAPSAIAAGDSGDVSLTFDASSFTSDTTLSVDVNVFSNDPQDDTLSFAATMVVRADTAVFDITSGAGAWAFGGAVVGDTLSGTASITIQNDGGANLVVDSLRLVDGTNWYTDLADSTVVEPNATSSFKVHFSPQAAGLHSDTLAFFINSDSTSGETVSMEGFGYTTNDSVYSSSAMSSWTNLYYSSSGLFTNYFTSSGQAYVVSPYMALGTDYDIIIRSANTDTTTAQYLMIYFSDDADATKWTSWTLLDSILVPAGTNSLTYYTADIGLTTADTGYVAIVKPVGGYYTYLKEVVLPKTVPEPVVASTTPEGYTLEGFDSGLPTGWTSNPYSSSWSAAGSGGYSGAYVKANVYGTSSNRKHFTTTEIGPISSGDSLVFAYSAREYNSSSAHEMGGGDSLAVSFTPSGGAKTVVWTIVDYNSADWAVVNVDLSDYNGLKGQFEFLAKRGQGDWDAGFDEVLYPLPSIAEMSAVTTLDFSGVALDTAASTGSRSVATNIINTGLDTLSGSITSRSTDFTLSSASISLPPGDTLSLTVTYAPSVAGNDTSWLDISSNQGITLNSGVASTADSIKVQGYALVADNYDNFEFTDYDSSGYTRYNTGGGVYWTDASSSGSSGSNSVRAVAHKWGGESWLVTPTFTASADGERLTWDMKVDDATPDANTTVFLMKVPGNTYADLANSTKLDSFTVGSSGGDMTTSWQTYFVDDYGVSGSLIYAFKFVDSDDAANSSANAADVYIDNIYFADAPSVPIVNLAGTMNEDIVLIEDGFDFDGVNLAQNTGGDTLYIDSIWTSDANLTVTLESDTVPKQGYVAVDFELDADSIVMGSYGAFVYFTHNDTLFSTGVDTFRITADFTDYLEDFEDGDLGSLITRDRDGDGYGWTASMISNGPNGSYGAYSNKSAATAISDNVLRTKLHDVTSGDKFIFHAKYTSTTDPDWMRVLISDDLGATWAGLDTVSMMGKTSWARYEYDLSDYVGDVVRLAIVDVNYGNSITDKLWVDRIMLSDRAVIGTIASYRTMNADSTYAFDDSVFTIRGVVTAAGSSFGSSGPSYMQDSTGGIAVYDSDFADSASVGDRVIMKGTGEVYANLFEIKNVSFIITEQGVSVDPEIVSLSSLTGTTGEGLEGQFLKVEDVTWVDESDWGTYSFNMEVTDGTDTATVRIDSDADIDNMPLGSLDIVGVLGQYSSSDPYSGFQLLPREQGDLQGYRRISGTVTDASSGSALSGVTVELGEADVSTAADGGYVIREAGDYTTIGFSKDGYTSAIFAVNVSTGGFDTLNVSMYYSPDSLLLSNGFDVSGSEGSIDTNWAAGDVQWMISGGQEVLNYNASTYSYDTVTISPTNGSNMIIFTDTAATAGGEGYENNSRSLWVLPEVVDLTGGADLNDHTMTLNAWVNSENNYDKFYVVLTSDALMADGTWYIAEEVSGGYFSDWDTLTIDLAPFGVWSDARIGLLFMADGSVIRGFGAAVDNMVINGRDMFAAIPPADLQATSMESGQVSLSWGAPGTDVTTLNIPTLDFTNDVDEIVNIINSENGNDEMTTEQWLTDMRAQNPRFTTHAKPKYNEVSYVPQRSSASRALVSYNVFRRALGEEFTLLDSSHSTGYTDLAVTDYAYYYYQVSAVYDEGESDPTADVMGVPGAVTDLTPDLSETFEVVATGETLPTGWVTINDGIQEVDWMVGDDGSFGSYNVPAHSDYAYIDGSDYNSGENVATTLVSPFYDFTNAEGAILTFDSYGQDYAGRTIMEVAYREGYGDWVLLEDVGYDHSDWESFELFLGDEIVGKEHVQLGFIYDDDDYYNWGWAIDNVQLMDKRAVLSVSIDSVGIVSADNVADSLTFTISNTGDWTLNYEISFDAGDDALRDIGGSYIEPDQSYYAAGDNELILSLYNASPDYEYLDSASVTFPDGVTINSASDFIQSSYNYLEASIAGQTITWGSTDGTGEIYGNTTVICTVSVNLGGDVVENGLIVDYTISGEVYGSEPHDVTGSFSVAVLPIGVTFTPSSGSINPGRMDQIELYVTYGAAGILENDIVITSTDLVNPEMHIPALIRTDYAPDAFALSAPSDDDTLTVLADTDSMSVAWAEAVDPDGDDVKYMLTIDGLPLSAGQDTFEFADTMLTAEMFDLPVQDIITALAGLGATPTYLTVAWDVIAEDELYNHTSSSNGPFTATLDLGWLMGTDNEPAIPDVFSLHQNYPNPFNPVTTIQYDIPEASLVRMDVYDILGRKVRTLVNHQHQAGYHAVMWNGQNDHGVPVATGMYIYRITAESEAGNFVSVKKLIMMK